MLIVDSYLSPAAERRLFALLAAHASASITTAVMMLRSRPFGTSWFLSNKAQRLLADGGYAWLDPTIRTSTRFALVLSPSLALLPPHQPLRLQADEVLIWPLEADLFTADFALPPVREQWQQLQDIFKAPTVWLARSEAERPFLSTRIDADHLGQEIWWPLIAEQAANGRSRIDGRSVAGRHWGQNASLDEQDLAEWQEAFFDPWQDSVALSGQHEFLRGLPPMPEGQAFRQYDDDQGNMPAFLSKIDLFIAIGDPAKPHRFQEETLEAIATGLPVITSNRGQAPHGGSLPSCEPCFLSNLAHHLLHDQVAYDEACRRQAALFDERHSAKAYLARLGARLKTTDRRQPLIWSRTTRHPGRILFLSDDSPYPDHLPRQQAIAQHLPPPLTPYFLTMAKDAAWLEGEGLPVEYLMAHSSSTYRAQIEDTKPWNDALDQHLSELLPFLDARAVVFDGTYPFAGLEAASKSHPSIPFIWLRRSLWQAGANPKGLERYWMFRLIIEPGDLASAFDQGPTTTWRHRVVRSEPIILGNHQMKTNARINLGLGHDDLAVLIDGSLPREYQGNSALQEFIRCLEHAGCRFWTAPLPAGPALDHLANEAKPLERPFAKRQLSAFDLVISGADYQSFHDLAFVGCPAVFLPDPKRPTDDQAARAAAAAKAGWADILAPGDVYGARSLAKAVLDEHRRQGMRACHPDPKAMKGAGHAALAISQLIHSLDLTKVRPQ